MNWAEARDALHEWRWTIVRGDGPVTLAESDLETLESIAQLLIEKGNSEPQEFFAQHLELLTKSARRCAYDLRHAADDVERYMPASERYVDWGVRANMWLDIFSPDGLKNYRTELHQEIMSLNVKIGALARRLKENDIEYRDIHMHWD